MTGTWAYDGGLSRRWEKCPPTATPTTRLPQPPLGLLDGDDSLRLTAAEAEDEEEEEGNADPEVKFMKELLEGREGLFELHRRVGSRCQGF